MTVVQDAFYIPDDIATGLATGIYNRIGSVVRYATGTNKGQIVKHLQPIELKVAEQSKSLCEKAICFISDHKKEAGIITIGVALVGVGVWGYTKWKNREPKALTEFRSAMGIYIDAIRNGNMDIEKISNLINALEMLKKHKDYDKISIQLNAEDIGVLVEHIYKYTVELADNNSVKLSNEEFDSTNNAILNLQSYLKAQKKIFELAA